MQAIIELHKREDKYKAITLTAEVTEYSTVIKKRIEEKLTGHVEHSQITLSMKELQKIIWEVTSSYALKDEYHNA